MSIEDEKAEHTARIRANTARRVATDPEFVASQLSLYREAEHRTPEMVAEELGISLATLDRLALCLRPRPETFAADVRTIAAHVGAHVGKLANILRRAEVAAAMRAGGGDGSRGVLMAARKRPVDRGDDAS